MEMAAAYSHGRVEPGVEDLVAPPPVATDAREHSRREVRRRRRRGSLVQQALNLARMVERRAAVRAPGQVRGDPRVGRQIAARNRFDRFEHFVTKHTSSFQFCFEQIVMLVSLGLGLGLLISVAGGSVRAGFGVGLSRHRRRGFHRQRRSRIS
jgi:hypothetical protein